MIVDFLVWRTPEVDRPYDKVIPDYRQAVEDQWHADQLFHREDLTEKLSRKMRRSEWQNAMAPKSAAMGNAWH
jgi:hypothetical protein